METVNKTKSQLVKEINELKLAAELIEQSSHRLTEIIENLPGGILIETDQNKILHVNKGFCRLFKIRTSPRKLCGQDVKKLRKGITQSVLEKNQSRKIEQILRRRQIVKDEEMTLADGRTFERDYIPVHLSPGVIVHLWHYRDVSENKKALEFLRESEERYRTVILALSEGIVLQNADGEIVACNASAERILGLSKAQMMGRTSLDPRWRAIHEGGLPFPGETHPAMVTLQTGEPCHNVIMGVHKPDNTLTWISINTQPLKRSGEKQPYAVVASFIDITVQKKIEEELRESKAKFVQAQYLSKLGDFIWQLDTGEVIWSEGMYKLLKYAKNDSITYDFINKKIRHPEDVEEINLWIKEAIASGREELQAKEYRLICKDGEIIYVHTEGKIEYKNGKAVRVFGFSQDITERKQAEERLQESERLLKTIADNFPHSYLSVIDKDLTIGFTAGEEFKHQNLDPNKFVGLKIEDIFSVYGPESLKKVKTAYLKTFTGQPQYFELFLNNQHQSYSTVPLPGEKDSIENILVVVQNITERKQAEQKLRESKERFDLALKGAELGSWDWDIQNDKVTFDHQWAAMIGYKLEEIKPHINSWKKLVHPDDLPSAMEALNDHLAGGTDFLEIEHRLKAKSGEWKWILNRGKVLERDDKGKPLRAAGTHLDISARKQAEAEKARLETQLHRAQKLETIGTLAGGIAHDFNNILTPILGYADMALSNLLETDPLTADLEEIFEGALRAKELVAQILTFSRQMEQKRVPLRLSLVVNDALKLLRPTLPSTIEIRQKIDDSAKKVLADVSQMHQVILNLCTNAFQAMQKKPGVLSIEIQQEKVDAKTAKYHPNLKEGEYLRLTVSDTGIGMDEATQERIFEPFFTTKSIAEGSGLGLSVVHGIVSKHEGEITVQSRPGKGSSFHVYLPVLKTKFVSTQKTVKKVKGGNQRILLVDDDRPVANVVKRMLEQLGYMVDLEISAQETLKIFRSNYTKYDLVITDLTMPQMTGLELAKKLHKIRKDIPVVIMTGYGEVLSGEKRKTHKIPEIIAKPIERRELDNVIHKVLGK